MIWFLLLLCFQLQAVEQFVSLGSVCEAAHALRGSDLSKAAYPFDWIVAFDGEKLIEMLDDDFHYFLDETFMVADPRDPGPLYHTYYRLEFLHEGDFRGNKWEPNLAKLKDKYQRRIQRFKNLSHCKDKVYFLRAASSHSTTDYYRFFHCKENLEISDDYSWALHAALKRRFPNIDFVLIIINEWDGNEVVEEKRLADNLIKIRANPTLDPPIKWALYKNYFEQLLQR